MPTYKAKQFDETKIQEIIRVHPNLTYIIGMKEDWDMVNQEIKDPEHPHVGIVDSSWWDTPIMKIYDSNGALISEMEVWKEIEYQDTEDNRKLHEKLLEDMLKRKKEYQSISSK